MVNNAGSRVEGLKLSKICENFNNFHRFWEMFCQRKAARKTPPWSSWIEIQPCELLKLCVFTPEPSMCAYDVQLFLLSIHNLLTLLCMFLLVWIRRIWLTINAAGLAINPCFLLILINDLAVLLYGEIRCWSLLTFKRLQKEFPRRNS